MFSLCHMLVKNDTGCIYTLIQLLAFAVVVYMKYQLAHLRKIGAEKSTCLAINLIGLSHIDYTFILYYWTINEAKTNLKNPLDLIQFNISEQDNKLYLDAPSWIFFQFYKSTN